MVLFNGTKWYKILKNKFNERNGRLHEKMLLEEVEKDIAKWLNLKLFMDRKTILLRG